MPNGSDAQRSVLRMRGPRNSCETLVAPTLELYYSGCFSFFFVQTTRATIAETRFLGPQPSLEHSWCCTKLQCYWFTWECLSPQVFVFFVKNNFWVGKKDALKRGLCLRKKTRRNPTVAHATVVGRETAGHPGAPTDLGIGFDAVPTWRVLVIFVTMQRRNLAGVRYNRGQ